MTRFLWGILLAVLGLSACGTAADSLEAAPTSRPEPAAIQESPAPETAVLKITVGSQEFWASFEDNPSAEEFRELLAQGPLTVEMEDYGGFEKVGPLGATLTRSDAPITTQPGDVILYQGSQITLYYGVNSWSLTRLARINDPTDLQKKLGEGTVSVTFSLEDEILPEP